MCVVHGIWSTYAWLCSAACDACHGYTVQRMMHAMATQCSVWCMPWHDLCYRDRSLLHIAKQVATTTIIHHKVQGMLALVRCLKTTQQHVVSLCRICGMMNICTYNSYHMCCTLHRFIMHQTMKPAAMQVAWHAWHMCRTCHDRLWLSRSMLHTSMVVGSMFYCEPAV